MALSLLLIASSVNALQLPTPARVPAADAISRRAFGAQTAAGLAALDAKSADDIRQHNRPVIAFSNAMAADLEVLRNFLFTNMWRHYKVNRMTSKAKRVVTDLFNLFMSETNTLPLEWQGEAGDAIATRDVGERARIIADYIASMTDRYAILEHERLFNLGPILR